MKVAKLLVNIFAAFYRDKEIRHHFRDLYNDLHSYIKILHTHRNYKEVLSKLKESSSKINVIFLVNEIAKWKTKALFDLMEKSSEFKPLVALTAVDFSSSNVKYSKERKARFDALLKYFISRNIPYVIAYDAEKDKAVDLLEFNPGIVFYQQPWDMCAIHHPSHVSKFAITCYVPYFVENYCILKDSCVPSFHPYLYKYYLLNKDFAYMYKQIFSDFRGEFIGVGHTALDQLERYCSNNLTPTHKKTVIYAPHWSITHPLNPNIEHYSTFQYLGQEILKFAQIHTNVNWIFKPHPILRFALMKTGIMSENEIDDYYNEWAKIGVTSFDNEYTKLFNESDLLITDCGSFLTEYFSTGKPIIHLYSEASTKPFPYMRPMFESFYRVCNYAEFESTFNQIIYQCKDVKKERRLKLLKFYGLCDNQASVRIMDDLKKMLSIDC